MSKNDLEEQLNEATRKLLQLARKSSWNRISNKTVYILTQIDPEPKLNVAESRKIRKKINDKKKTHTLKSATQELLSFYDDLYDINLYLYRSKRNRTIVEIQYFLKSFHAYKFQQSVRDNSPMLHCKIALPPYRRENKKFDINWELGGLRHQWNEFWWRRKMTKRFSK